MLLSGGNQAKALGGRAGHLFIPIEAMHEGADNFVFFLRHHNVFCGFDARAALAAALGGSGERLFQLIYKTQVIHHQTAWLVAEYAIHACDGRHQAVAVHRLVGIHLVQARRIQAGQPPVAHDHDAERVTTLLETPRQVASTLFVADMRLPV